MLYLEETVETVINNNGLYLLTMNLITDVLNLSWKRMESIFVQCVKEYSRRRPISIVADFSTSGTTIQMPDNTIDVQAIRYGVLSEYPATFQDAWDYRNIEFDRRSNVLTLKVWPPIGSYKVRYLCYPTTTTNELVTETITIVEGENSVTDILKAAFRSGTLTITKGDLTMVETDREDVTTTVNGMDITQTIVTVEGTLGDGTINLNTREYTFTLDDTTAGDIDITYYPQYKVVPEMDIGNHIFFNFFSLRLLESIAAARAQVQQPDLQNVMLDGDMLFERLAELRSTVRRDMRSSIAFGNLMNY